jgi:hypothetical protein
MRWSPPRENLTLGPTLYSCQIPDCLHITILSPVLLFSFSTSFIFSSNFSPSLLPFAAKNMAHNTAPSELPTELRYLQYEHALEKKFLPSIRALISKDLSEPYSIYVYRFFLYQWGELCYMVIYPLPPLYLLLTV